ncbi:hypothetical protein [Sphingopyxis sp.]|uniref:hypothetical protein n=1 Tax=Sphingopyxis sp. TaxID=1908224 RepID=UPI001D751294|nr:hypothetical protein [Sphingopyxis sp.]MBW8294662.1 hypothetical protein [Sphingopyxis sp.]
MTIFHSEPIGVDQLSYQFVSANDPDIIGVEVMLDGHVLFDISMNPAGETSELFDSDGWKAEFDLSGLRSVLTKCEAELNAWREGLMKPGEIWSAQ